MKLQRILRIAMFLLTLCLAQSVVHAQRQMEKLGRGLIAIRTSSTQVYLGWRLLGNDPEDVAFNLYRSANGATPVKLNASPLTATTDYVDTPANLSTTAYTYSVKTVQNGVEVTDRWANPLSSPYALPVNATIRQYFPVHLTPTPDDATTGVSYKVKFCWVGDFDGDGEYDFVVDRYNPTVAARQWLQAYKRDGTLLWQMNMGPNSVNHYNIEPGSSTIGIGHGDNVTAYDLDGDGKAEVIVRTANGVIFGDGTTLTDTNDSNQFISILDGMTGAELARAPVPNARLSDGPMNGHMGIFYPDGLRPSVFLAAKNRAADSRFHGNTTVWDYRNGQLTQRWTYNSETLGEYAPEAHQIRLGDPNNDGKDDFIDIGYGIDDSGKQLFAIPEVVHGDRFHMTDIDPDRPGLETFLIQQDNGKGLATAYVSSDTGKFIKKWYAGGVVDVGRGVAGEFDSPHKGLEFFSTQANTYDCKGNAIYSTKPFPPECIWWDSDLGREFVGVPGSSGESPTIDKFNTSDPANNNRLYTIYNETPPGVYQAYGGRPAFWGDLFGDWREELLCVASDNSELRIYTTKNPDSVKSSNGTPFRIYTLMHNPQYRIQTTVKGYVQASYVDYYLGYNMPPPQPPPMVDTKLVWRGGAGATVWDVGTTQSWTAAGANSLYGDGDVVRFDANGNNATTVALSGNLQPGAVTVYSPKSYTFDGTGGSLGGAMKLLKAGAGTLTLSGTHSYSGKTTIWDGAFIVNGTLAQSPVTIWGGTWGGVLASGVTGGRIGGAGTFAQPVALKYRGAITPGAGMGSAGTLTLGSGLTADDGSLLALDLSDDPTGLIKANDRIAVTGNLVLGGTVSIIIKPLNTQLAPGTYTLLTYTGTLTGSVSNLAVTLPVGTPYTLAAGGGVITLTVPFMRAAAATIWRGTGAAWDLASSQNWLRGGLPDLFVSGDTVTFDATGATAPTVTLNGGLPVGGVAVNASTNYTFAGSGYLSGTGGLSKAGTGTLTINTTNDYTGPTTITGGVLAIAALNDGGVASSIGAASTSASNLVINGGGTLRLTGSQTNTNRSLTIGTGGAIFDIATTGSSMQISGVATGTGALTKNGPGTLILANANTYSGGTIINAGTIYLAGSTPNTSGLGSGSVTINTGTLTMSDVQASETAAWNLVVPAGAIARLNTDGRCTLTGSLTGAGTFTVWTGYVRTDFKGNWSAFTGQVNMVSDGDGGDFRITNTSGYGNAALDLGAEVNAYYNQTLSGNLTIPIGALSGANTSLLLGGSDSGKTVTYQLGAKNTDTTFAGAVGERSNSNSPVAIQKVGTGWLTLTGANTYIGATTVSAGTLLVNGTLGSTAVTVVSGAALGGTGSIGGVVEIKDGGGLVMPANSTDTLTVNGTLTLGGTITVLPNPNGGALQVGTYQLITGTGTINNTATFVWGGVPVDGLGITFDNLNRQMIVTHLTTNVTWTGSVSNIWDTSTLNWRDTFGSTILAFIAQNSVTFDDTSTTTAVTISGSVAPSDLTVARSSNSLTLTGVIADATPATASTTLLKTGTASLTLNSANTFGGGTTLQGGTVLLAGGTGNGQLAIGTGKITFTGGTLTLNGYTGTSTPTLGPLANDLEVPAGMTGRLNIQQRGDVNSKLTGSGTLTLGVTYVRGNITGDWSAFAGKINVVNDGSATDDFRINSSAGFANAAINLASGVQTYCRVAGSTIVIGELSGASGSTIVATAGSSNSGGAQAATWSVGALNTDATYAGIIRDGAGIVKTGTGAWTLGGANTYTGTTTVNGGTLKINGNQTAATGAVTIAAGGTLGGLGTVGGAATIQGRLSPGDPLGTLNFAKTLTITSAAQTDFTLGSTGDWVVVTGNLTLAGTLNITAGSDFGVGTYTLFTYSATLSGALTLGTVPANYTCVLDTATAGQIRVIVSQSFAQWQMQNFNSTSAANALAEADPDGDGLSNYAEYLAGTNPVDPGSLLRITGVTLSGGGIVATWTSAPGKTYLIEYTTDPAAGWQTLATVPAASAPATATAYTDPSPTGSTRLYRVKIIGP